MKKFSKIMASALCAVLCVLVFVGCSGADKQLNTEAGVSTKGLKASNAQEYNTFMATLNSSEDGGEEVNTELSAYRYTIEMKDGANATNNVYMNGIVKLDENGELSEMATKITMNYLGFDISAKVYVKNGVGYIEMKMNGETAKIKMDLSDVLPKEDVDYSSPELSTTGGYSGFFKTTDLVSVLEGMGDMAELDVDDTTIVVKKYNSGDVTRFIIEKTDEGATSKYAFEFDGNNITGVSFETVAVKDGISNTYRVAVSKFSGNISFPSFDKYTDITSELQNPSIAA